METFPCRSAGLACFVLLACGGNAPPPLDPAGPPRMGAPAKAGGMDDEMAMEGMPAAEEPEEEGDDPTVSTASSEPAPAEPAPAAPSVQKPSRPPSEILTGAKISFMINYPASAPKAAAEEKCTKEHGEDMAARAKCMSEARKEFLADVLLLKKTGETRFDLYVYRRDRSNLLELSTSAVELVNETENAITLKLVGKGTGARPIFLGAKEIPVSVPSDSSIELTDPVLGRLVYEAKIGMVGE